MTRTLAITFSAGLCATAAAQLAPDGPAEIQTIRVDDQGGLVSGMFEVERSIGERADEVPQGVPQMPGWPLSIPMAGNFAPTRGMVFADLDGDGDLEIVTSSTDRRVYAWHHDGTAVAGFPVVVNNMAQYAPSVGDLDGDGDLEIVQNTRGLTSGGRLYVIDHEGNNVPGFPLSLGGNNIASCPTLHDLDGDGDLEIIVGSRAYPIGYLHVIEHDGTEWGGNWPVALDHVPTGSASVGDVDGDGSPEVFYMSYNSMYLVKTDGTMMAGWPQGISGANFSYQSAAMADLDGDGDLEIAVGAHKTSAGCYVFHHDGTAYPGWPKFAGTWTYCPPTVTDLEGDGELEILHGRAGVFGGFSACFWAWTSSGDIKSGFPYSQSHGGGSDGPLTVADIDGDGRMEIFADHNVMVDDQGFLFGVDSDGNDLPGFPIRTNGFTYMNGAAVGDVDGDGDYELGVLAYRDTTVEVSLFDLDGPLSSTDRDWTVYHGRNERGGLYPVEDGCVPDFNGDGIVNTLDFISYLNAYNESDPRADLNGDGIVNTLDFLVFLNAYNDGC